MLGIAKQNEWQIVLGPKSLMRMGIVWTDADHHGILFLNLDKMVPGATGLRGTTRRIILGIEIENNLLTT